MDFRQRRKNQQLKHHVSDANISDANVSDANVSGANVSDANVSGTTATPIANVSGETIYLNINGEQYDTPFLIIGNSSFNENFIHIRENNINNMNYQAIYGYFSKYNENNSSDVYKLQLYNSNSSILFSSEYGISLSSDTPTFKGCLFTTMKINNNNNNYTISITKNANVIVR
jgi:hypothetical protein